jgi:site-specific DNA recombinase
MKPVTRVVGYVRVSTDKQGDQGVSLEAQTAKVRAYAALHDLELVDIVVETESAKSLARPGLTRALAMLGTDADALLVTKLDRLTRSVRDLGTLIEEHFGKASRAALLSVSEHVDTRTASGRMVLNIMASVAQAEREMIGERTSVAMQHMKARGQYTGGPAPFGMQHTADGLRPREDEACTRARASELRAQGLSLRAVSEALASEGRLSRSGAPFVPAAVSKMLQRTAA